MVAVFDEHQPDAIMHLAAEAHVDRSIDGPAAATAELPPPRPAPRPANSVLSTAKYEALGYPAPRHFSEALADVIDAYSVQ